MLRPKAKAYPANSIIDQPNGGVIVTGDIGQIKFFGKREDIPEQFRESKEEGGARGCPAAGSSSTPVDSRAPEGVLPDRRR